jgi:hypothetical protein
MDYPMKKKPAAPRPLGKVWRVRFKSPAGREKALLFEAASATEASDMFVESEQLDFGAIIEIKEV